MTNLHSITTTSKNSISPGLQVNLTNSELVKANEPQTTSSMIFYESSHFIKYVIKGIILLTNSIKGLKME